MLYRTYLFAALSIACVFASATDVSQPAKTNQAQFAIKNVFTVKVPAGSQTVRMWFALPQEESHSVIRNLNVTSDFPVRYETDSSGNRVGYIELHGPQPEQITIQEVFDLTRFEIRNVVNAAATRPLTEAEQSALARYLQPSTQVIVNDTIRKLAASITGGETNPVLATRKLYNWTYKNVNYWGKDTDHVQA